jgi:hypothetical protein
MTDPTGVVRWTCPPMLPGSARSRRCWPSKCLSGWRECAEARLGRWREPSSCLVAAVGTVALAVSPSPSRQGCRAASAGPTEGRSASGRPSSWSGLSRMSECLLCRSPPVRVRCPVPGVRCAGVRVRASRVRVRLSAQAGFVERVGAAGQPHGWTGDLGVVASRVRERPARLPESGWRGRSWRRPSGSTEASAVNLAAVLGWMRSGRGCSHVQPPGRPGQPVGREGRPSVGWTITVGERGARNLRPRAA